MLLIVQNNSTLGSGNNVVVSINYILFMKINFNVLLYHVNTIREGSLALFYTSLQKKNYNLYQKCIIFILKKSKYL